MLDVMDVRSIDVIVLSALFPLLILYIAFGVDEALFDLLAWKNGFQGGRVETLSEAELKRKDQKRIAIAVAAWHEHEVIARMVRGNRRRIEYENYEFFIGVYPNDPDTRRAVEQLVGEVPGVHMVINSRPGPTSKGQMLNEVAEKILQSGRSHGQLFEAILVHDCEDLIHPASLLALNAALDEADFVQVPVFSLQVKSRELIAGVYMDEFAESHTKDMRLRCHLSSSIPGAGVGMALSRKLVESYFASAQGAPFREASLTEDYELGVRVRDFGGRCHFLFAQLDTRPGEIIATREYFPKRFLRSVRQKTRWTMGIVFQGTRFLGWRGNLIEKYFFYRDRKGVAANLAVLSGLLISAYAMARLALSGWLGPLQVATEQVEIGIPLFSMTSFLMVNRIAQRYFACLKVYGWKPAVLVPVRIIVGNIVNALASIRAIYQYVHHLMSGASVKWAKTEHELPEDFGIAH